MADNLTQHATEGFNAPANSQNPYLYSAPTWYAWAIGQHFRASGKPAPSNVRMSRGASIRVGAVLFRFGKNDVIERVS